MLDPKKPLHQVLLSLGFSADYEPTYALNQAGLYLSEAIDFTKIKGGDKDIRWLSNRMVKAIAKTKDICIDNQRAARVVKGVIPESYILKQDAGCCGFCDIQAVNPATGNEYIFGFNYGH